MKLTLNFFKETENFICYETGSDFRLNLPTVKLWLPKSEVIVNSPELSETEKIWPPTIEIEIKGS